MMTISVLFWLSFLSWCFHCMLWLLRLILLWLQDPWFEFLAHQVMSYLFFSKSCIIKHRKRSSSVGWLLNLVSIGIWDEVFSEIDIPPWKLSMYWLSFTLFDQWFCLIYRFSDISYFSNDFINSKTIFYRAWRFHYCKAQPN